MRLSQLCIDRPVLSIVMSLAIVVFGFISFGRLTNRELPDIDRPIVSVLTILPGAAPETVENSVTQVLEDEIIGIAGIRHVSSVSREEVSAITVEFRLDRDVNEAAAEVRDRVARAREMLPEEAKEPIVSKADSGEGGLIWMVLGGAGLSRIELTSLLETQIKDRLTRLPGVARLQLDGDRRYAIRLRIDHHRLTARGLVIADVAEALRRSNVDIPSGRVESLDQEFSVRTPGELRTAEEYNALIVANVNGEPVRIRDIGRAEVGAENERSISRVDGEVGIGIGVMKQSKANALDVARAVKAEMDNIRPDLPEGVIFEPVWDVSIYIEHAVKDVTWTIVYAVFLVLVVIFIFLRSLRATVIPAVAIPISIIGTFGFLYLFDFSINTLTLMALTLAIGLVVDDAIVVLENVSRWIEQGTPRLEATRRGMAEISFAVVSATVSVIVVFLPLAFLTGTTGKLFREFGVAVAAAVGISGFVALTLAPALCARVLRTTPKETAAAASMGSALDRLREIYGRALARALNRPVLMGAFGVFWVALGWLLFQTIDREFIPDADRGSIIVYIQAPEGSTLEYTNRYQIEVEKGLLEVPEIKSSVSIVATGWQGPPVVNKGIIFAALHPDAERKRSQQEIVDELYYKFSKIPGINVYPVNEPALTVDWDTSPVSIVVQGPDIRRVAGYADEVIRRARDIPGLVNLQNDLKLNKPEIVIQVDRERASDLGVSIREVASTLQILLGGLKLSSFKLDGETYEVIAQLDREQRSSPTDLYGLYVRSESGQLIPLASVVRLEETVTAPGLPHLDRMRTATVSGNLLQGFPLGTVLTDLRAIADEVVPDSGGYRVDYSGYSERFFESESALVFAYALAVLLIYLVLAAQFESFIHPATILVAVAMSFTGALLTLWVTDNTLNLFSQIGLVMLVGLVTKNSILIVEFANQLRARGVAPLEAALKAAQTRFRPVMMTSLSTIVGILPIAFALGTGAEARAPLGVAVAGGMAFGTLLTLFLVPAVYLGFARLEGRLGEGVAAGSTTAPTQPVQTGAG